MYTGEHTQYMSSEFLNKKPAPIIRTLIEYLIYVLNKIVHKVIRDMMAKK